MAEPIRRRIVELLASGEHIAGDIESVIVVDDNLIGLLERNARALRRRWKRRIGWRVQTDPLGHFTGTSKRGRRGHGADPDDPWTPPRRKTTPES